MDVNMYWAALFNRAPALGEINPSGEIFYVGYRRVAFLSLDGRNLEEIQFNECLQDEPVFASHVVAFDSDGRVVGVKAL